MSLEFIDGFDHYNNQANLQRKWDVTASIDSFQAGRFAGNSVRQWNVANLTLTQGQLAAVATRTIGFAFYIDQNNGSPSGAFVQFLDSGNPQVDLRINSALQLVATRNGTVLGTSSQSLVISTWYYMEFQATINASAGSVTARVGGVSWINVSGVNTQNTGNASTNGLQCGSVTNLGARLDDLYILNSSGSANNTFLGESRILTSLPTGDDASFKAWTPSAGTAHYANVNQNPPDDDTTYNSSATAGQIDLFTYPAISPTGPIAAVQVVLCERKDDAGTRTTVVEYRSSGGTNYAGANNFSPGTNYLMNRQIFETDPATSAAWTTAGVNGGEFGINCIA